MRRTKTRWLLGLALLIAGPAAADAPAGEARPPVAVDGEALPTDRATELDMELLGDVLPGGIKIGRASVRRLVIDPRGFLTFDEALADWPPGPLDDAPRSMLAGFWRDRHPERCADDGRMVWAPTGHGLRVSWLGMPIAGCEPGHRATFSVELAVDGDGRPARVELVYAALPDSTAVEPRAGIKLGETVLELLPDGREADVKGRAKRLLSLGSERLPAEDGRLTGPIVPGWWVIELDAEGRIAHDPDEDGVRSADNCPRQEDSNPWQWDIDGDEDGDACDRDMDGDRIELRGGVDNCPFTLNEDQADRDGDGVGDVCDDSDGDLLVDQIDGCPDDFDPAGLDLDQDGTPDACDADIDGDDVFGVGPRPVLYDWRVLPLWAPSVDGCPYRIDWRRVDHDRDGVQDVCDRAPDAPCKGFACVLERDDDGDGIANTIDLCPTVADGAQADGDEDGIGDVCDADRDQDGVPDVYTDAFRCDPTVCGRYQ